MCLFLYEQDVIITSQALSSVVRIYLLYQPGAVIPHYHDVPFIPNSQWWWISPYRRFHSALLTSRMSASSLILLEMAVLKDGSVTYLWLLRDPQ